MSEHIGHPLHAATRRAGGLRRVALYWDFVARGNGLAPTARALDEAVRVSAG
ncbi:hypothetical protein [Nocardia sp. NPDC003345]